MRYQTDCKPLPDLRLLRQRLELVGSDVIWLDCPRKPFMNGKRAGKPERNGYITIKFQGECFMAHRIAWKLAHGVDPLYFIDHIDCNKQNNSIDNLQDVPQSTNMAMAHQRNGKTTLPGVSFRKRGNSERYNASTKFKGKAIYLGSYKTEAEAHEAYKQFHESLQD